MRRRLVAIPILAIVTLGSLLACNRGPTPSSTPAGGVGASDSGEQAFGSGPPTSPTASQAPPTSPAPPDGGGATPQSTLPSKAGFAWVSNPNASYTATGAYQFNSAGGAVNITHSGTGRYVVSFAGLGSSGGVAHAQAYGNNSNYCTVDYWNSLGGNQNIAVSCFNQAGAYVNTQFVADWAAGSQDNAQFAYLWAEQQTNTSAYHPASAYRYDSLNSADLTVKKLSTGRYQVVIPVSGVGEPAFPWGFQITAYASRQLCKLHSFDPATRTAVVACRTPGGLNVDTRFSLSYYAYASMLGRIDNRFDVSGTGYSGVANPSTGVYTATLSQLGESRGHVVAVATGTGSTYCHVRNWAKTGADLSATTVCFNPGGAAASSSFLVSAAW